MVPASEVKLVVSEVLFSNDTVKHVGERSMASATTTHIAQVTVQVESIFVSCTFTFARRI